MFGLTNRVNGCGKGFTIIRAVQPIRRRRAEKSLQANAPKRRAGGLFGWKRDSLCHRSIGCITGHAIGTLLGVPEIASGIATEGTFSKLGLDLLEQHAAFEPWREACKLLQKQLAAND